MASDEPRETMPQILTADPRYSPQAYLFLFEALNVTAHMLGRRRKPQSGEGQHVSGQQLLEGIRRLGLRQFGFLARTVFESWGVTSTDDWGEIVFNLVDGKLMNKTDRDRKEDFQNVYDFEETLESAYFRDRLYSDDEDVFELTSSIPEISPTSHVQELLDALAAEGNDDDRDGEHENGPVSDGTPTSSNGDSAGHGHEPHADADDDRAESKDDHDNDGDNDNPNPVGDDDPPAGPATT